MSGHPSQKSLWQRARQRIAAVARYLSASQERRGLRSLHLSQNERRLAAINAIATTMSQSLGVEEMLSVTLDKVLEVTQVEAGGLYIVDEETNTLKLAAQRGLAEEEVAAARQGIPLGQGPLCQVAVSGQPRLVEDVSQDATLSRAVARKERLCSLAAAPLVAKGKTLGVLAIISHGVRAFTAEDMGLLVAIGSEVGVAMENARLYEQLARSEEDYRRLFEGASDAIWVHDLEGNIIAVNTAGAEMSGYTVEELLGMKVTDFLSADGMEVARQVRRLLLQGEGLPGRYIQRIIRKDGSTATLELATSLITREGQPYAFHQIARDVTEQRRLQESLQFYITHITNAQEEERKRIARELHDETIQELVGLSHDIDAMAEIKESPGAVVGLQQLRAKVSEILEGVRRFSRDLRPPLLEELGLPAALEWLAEELDRLGIRTRVEVAGEERRLTPEAELILFRVAQEALSNIRKHAEATQATVRVEFSQARVRLAVVDDGKGFDPPQVMSDLARSGKLGLIGMQERIRIIGGTLDIRSQPGAGSEVIVEAHI